MIDLPKIALGAWAWGNDGTFGNNFTAEALKPIFDAAMASGLNLWDTAYAYGMGTSEKVLAGFIRDLPRESYLISDKFTPQCANGKPTAMADMIDMTVRNDVEPLLGKRSQVFLTGGGIALMRGAREALAAKINRPIKVSAAKSSKLNSPVFSASLGLADLVFDSIESQGGQDERLSSRLKNLFSGRG